MAVAFINRLPGSKSRDESEDFRRNPVNGYKGIPDVLHPPWNTGNPRYRVAVLSKDVKDSDLIFSMSLKPVRTL